MASPRPSDHIDAPPVEPVDESIAQPKLGFVGYARFFWRQLTSMRTALFLLLLLAFAAVPGSLVPQRSSDPNGVVQYKADNPDLFPILDNLQVFDTYTSIWFSSIYLLLFISLIGCVIPRTKHHWQALRSAPPKTPARLDRLPAFQAKDAPGIGVDQAVEAGRAFLKSQGYRVRVFADSVSAERGYLRETGNLVFHGALVGILVAVGIGGGFGYSGQKVVVEGQAMSNVLGNYDSFNPGRFFASEQLAPYAISLNTFEATYEQNNIDAYGQPIDYTANVTTSQPGSEPVDATIKVNEPLRIGNTEVYLLGNGYAPWITVRDGEGNIAFSQPVAFLPQDANLTSLGVVKVPDGLDEQLGMIGFFYPTTMTLTSGALSSSYPDLLDATLTLEAYTGDLGLNEGVPTSAYSLDTASLTQVAGRKSTTKTLTLSVGETAELPDGLGSVELTSVKRFVSLDVHHDPTSGWVLGFSILVLAGLLTGLFVPRRRVWIKAIDTGDGVRLEYAALARGEDPALDAAITAIAQKHGSALGLKVEQ